MGGGGGGWPTGTGPGKGEARGCDFWPHDYRQPYVLGLKEKRNRIERDIFQEGEVFFIEESELTPTGPLDSLRLAGEGRRDRTHQSLCCSPPGSLGHREREQLTQSVLGTVPQAVGGRLHASVLSSRGWWQQGVGGLSSSPWGPGCPRCHSQEVCQALA